MIYYDVWNVILIKVLKLIKRKYFKYLTGSSNYFLFSLVYLSSIFIMNIMPLKYILKFFTLHMFCCLKKKNTHEK